MTITDKSSRSSVGRMWFPNLADAPEKRLAAGVRAEQAPDLEAYKDLLASRYQTLVNQMPEAEARAAIEDLLPHGTQVTSQPKADWGAAIVETDEVDLLAGAVMLELLDQEKPLDPAEARRLQEQSQEANLTDLLSMI